MMQHEFEALAGYEVRHKDYVDIIEPMYMATNLSKQEFVKVIDKKRFAMKPRSKYVKEMKKVANIIMDECHLRSTYEEKEELERLAAEYRDNFHPGMRFGTTETMNAYRCHYPIVIAFWDPDTFSTIEEIELF